MPQGARLDGFVPVEPDFSIRRHSQVDHDNAVRHSLRLIDHSGQGTWRSGRSIARGTRIPFQRQWGMPGVNLDLAWEIVKDCFGMETVTSANGARDDAGHAFVNFAEGITAVFNLTQKLEAFIEYDLFVPLGAVAPEQAHLQEYIVGGFVYFLSNDLEVDIRAGVGLNNHASDYLLGTGFAARY